VVGKKKEVTTIGQRKGWRVTPLGKKKKGFFLYEYFGREKKKKQKENFWGANIAEPDGQGKKKVSPKIKGKKEKKV